MPIGINNQVRSEFEKNPVLLLMYRVCFWSILASIPLFLLTEYVLFKIYGSIPTLLGYLVLIFYSLVTLYAMRTFLKWRDPLQGQDYEPNRLNVIASHVTNAQFRILVLTGCLDDHVFTNDTTRKALCQALANGVLIEIVWGTPHANRKYPEGSAPPAILTADWSGGINFYQLHDHPGRQVLLIDRHVYRYVKAGCCHLPTGERKTPFTEEQVDGLLVFDEEVGFRWCEMTFRRFKKRAQPMEKRPHERELQLS